MNMFKIDSAHFGGVVKVISPTVSFSDSRGAFSVDFRKDDFARLRLPSRFMQFNSSRSAAGVIRGLHFQFPMGKVMSVTSGRAYLVTVDLRSDSPTFLKWFGVEATADNRIQVWAPSEFARGYCALEDNTQVQYKCTAHFDAEADDAIAWNDPDIGVEWPTGQSKLHISARDSAALTVRERGMLA